jgi:hypothetical protein
VAVPINLDCEVFADLQGDGRPVIRNRQLGHRSLPFVAGWVCGLRALIAG